MVLGEGPAVRTDWAEPLLLQLVGRPHVLPQVGEAVLVLPTQGAAHQGEGGQEVGEAVDEHLRLVLQLDQTLRALGNQADPLVVRRPGGRHLLLLGMLSSHVGIQLGSLPVLSTADIAVELVGRLLILRFAGLPRSLLLLWSSRFPAQLRIAIRDTAVHHEGCTVQQSNEGLVWALPGIILRRVFTPLHQ